MRSKTYGQKTFTLSDRVTVECEGYETRYSWGHKAYLFVNGYQEKYKKITYYNRTWESYTYQTILRSIVEDTPANILGGKAAKDQFIKDIQDPDKLSQDGSHMKAVAMVAAMGEIFGSTKKEKNDWKARMLKAGLGNSGLSMPEDWDTLTEEEKEKRLNGAIEQLK